MKKLFKISSALVMFAFVLSSCAGTAVIAVRERPAEPVFVRPVEPYRGAVYVPGEWEWRGRQYVYIQPHYVRPQRGRVWIQGHWEPTRGGYAWRKGYWR